MFAHQQSQTTLIWHSTGSDIVMKQIKTSAWVRGILLQWWIYKNILCPWDEGKTQYWIGGEILHNVYTYMVYVHVHIYDGKKRIYRLLVQV